MKKLFMVLAVMLLVTVFFYGTAKADAVESKYNIKIYGKVKADMAWDDSDLAHNNFSTWVQQETSGGPSDVGSMSLTANETRLGFKFSGPDYEDLTTKGVLEIDFYGGNNENKSYNYMRHAFFEFTWPNIGFSILAGQTWDVIAPLNPSTLNYSVMWWQGNIQYRRPQLRFSENVNISDGTKLLFQLALARNIGDTSGSYTTLDSGADNETPIIEFRTAFTFPGIAQRGTTIGLSGATGSQTRYTDAAATVSKDYDVEVFALDLTIPFAKAITFKSEYWTGKNVSTFLGGIGQGIATPVGSTTPKEVEADGFWASLAFKFASYWHINVGYGMDDPDKADLGVSGRTKNEMLYANVIYDLSEAISMGLEISSLTTDYANAAAGSQEADNTRVQFSWIYKF